MAKLPDSQRAATNGPDVSLRGRTRLPVDRPVTVEVLRLSLAGLFSIAVVLGLLSFLIGVLAGTSGQYREFVNLSTGWMGVTGGLHRAALWPDRLSGETPLLGDRLEALSKSLGHKLAEAKDANDDIVKRYRNQVNKLLEYRVAVGVTRNACSNAAAHGKLAANHGLQATEQVELLRALLAAAAQLCAARDDAPLPSVPQDLQE